MNENGWGLTEMLAFCTILLIGFFASTVVAKKNFGEFFEDNVKLEDSVSDIKENKSKDTTPEVEVDYSKLEESLKDAAVEYNKDNKEKKLITLKTLIANNNIKEIHDPKDYSNMCNGYVIYEEGEYKPYLRCIGNYATEQYNLDYEI